MTSFLKPGGPASTAKTRPNAQGCRSESSDGSQAQKQGRISDLRPAQGDRGAGERPDQGSQRIAALPVAGTGEGGWGMASDRRDAQPAEVVPIQAIPAGAGTGCRVKAMGVAVAVGPAITHRASIKVDDRAARARLITADRLYARQAPRQPLTSCRM